MEYMYFLRTLLLDIVFPKRIFYKNKIMFFKTLFLVLLIWVVEDCGLESTNSRLGGEGLGYNFMSKICTLLLILLLCFIGFNNKNVTLKN